jgi:hypothetical protein
MANRKGKSSRKRRTSEHPSFAQFKGKIVDDIEARLTDEGCAIGIMFEDRTYLSFDVDMGVTILPELSDFKTGEYRPLKRWRPITI